MNVAVIGASKNPERYSYKAVMLLLEKGHQPFAVHPGLRDFPVCPVFKSLREVDEDVHTVTVYLSAKNQGDLEEEICSAGVQRVIFNPGSENPELAETLRTEGIVVVEACTLVMLHTGQF